MRFLRQNTTATVHIGPLIDWRDARTPLTDNGFFSAASVQCRLIDDSGAGRTLTLTKTGGANNINLDGFGLASITLAASDLSLTGELRLTLLNSVVGGISSDLILPVSTEFCVLPASVFDALIGGSAELVVALTSAYDAAKTAAAGGGRMNLTEEAVAIVASPVIRLGRRWR